jgi:hypothetical protein
MPRIPNPQCPWVQAQDGQTVKIREVAYIPAELSGNRNALYVVGVKNGAPHYGEPFKMLLPGSEDDFAITPTLVTDMSGGGFDPGKGQRGPFKFVFGDASVDGFGLPLNRHVAYVIVVDYGGSPAPAPTPAAAQLNAQQLDPQTVVLHLIS